MWHTLCMAENRTPKGTFKPGVSGNPSGRKPKANRIDGWESALTGIGNENFDRRTSHDFCPTALTYEKCIDICEGDDLGRRAAYGPVEDAFRQGYEISIADEGDFEDLKEDIEDKLRELEVDKVIKKAIAQKRALGGSAILIGVRDNKTMDRPLDRKNISNIEFLTNLEPADLYPHTYYDNPVEPKFGDVKLWELRTVGRFQLTSMQGKVPKTAATEAQAKSILIHESRLIIFTNEKISQYSMNHHPHGQFWGLSIYVPIYEILRDFNVSWSAAGLIVTDFSQAVFTVKNLMQLVANNEAGLVARMRAMNLGRSTARAILIDDQETFKRESVNVNGLPDLLDQLKSRFAAAIDTPLSVLMGSGKKAQSAEMDGELRYYYDRLASMQRDEIGPIIRLFAEIIMRGLRQRKIPKKWGVKWHPLWQLTDEQKANARLAQARVDAIYVQYGILDPQIIAQMRFGGEYSFDTAIPNSYESPGFMAIAPTGVLVDGMDPKTGLPPGVQPDPGVTGATSIKPHVRRNPRQINNKGKDPTAGGATPGRGQATRDAEDTENQELEEHGAGCYCEVCRDLEEQK